LKDSKLKEAALIWLAFVATALMLTLIQAPVGWSALGWVSLVPFIFACSPAAKPKSLAVTSYVISLCYWLGNLYWMGYGGLRFAFTRRCCGRYLPFACAGAG